MAALTHTIASLFLNGLGILPFHTEFTQSNGRISPDPSVLLHFDHNNKQQHRPMHYPSSFLFPRPFFSITPPTHTLNSITSTLVSLLSLGTGSSISCHSSSSPIFLSFSLLSFPSYLSLLSLVSSVLSLFVYVVVF